MNLVETVREIFRIVGLEFPDEISEQFRNDSYSKSQHELPMRLLSPQEALEIYNWLEKNLWVKGLCPLWTDDNSNYAAVYIHKPLNYRVCFIDHEEIDLSPVFVSVESFLEVLESNHGKDWYYLPRDYPVLNKIILRTQIKTDLEVIEELKQLMFEGDADKRQYYAFCIMALTPYQHIDMLIPFLTDDDMWIQERACTVFGLHQYEPVVDLLKQISEKGKHNGKLAAKRALSLIMASKKR